MWRVYCSIAYEREHQQDKNETDCLKQLSMAMDDAIEELTYLLLQAGDHVCKCKQAAYHLLPQRDLTYMFDRNG